MLPLHQLTELHNTLLKARPDNLLTFQRNNKFRDAISFQKTNYTRNLAITNRNSELASMATVCHHISVLLNNQITIHIDELKRITIVINVGINVLCSRV